MDRNPESSKAKALAKPVESTREERLKAALKANMGRRKAQARARAAGPDGDPQDGAEDNGGTTREA